MRRKRYAMGASDVPPKPGDTTTSGSWDPNTGTNPTGQAIRKGLGMGVPRPGYADGASDVTCGMEQAMSSHADKMHPTGRR